MAKEQEQRSVRVEFDSGAGDHLDIPEVLGGSSGSGGPQRLLIVLAVGVVGAIIVALAFLRPAADEAADGSTREAPTTNAPTTTVVDSEEVDELAAAAEVVATPLAIEEPIAAIVSHDGGFVALGNNPSATPRIFRSPDGRDWVSVATTLETTGGRAAAVPQFRQLSRIGDQLAVTTLVRDQSAPVGLLLFVSDDGASWVELDTPGSTVFGGPTGFMPTNLSEDSIWGFQFAGSPLVEQLLAEATTLEVASGGVCTIDRDLSDAENQTAAVLDCADVEIGTIDQTTVRPGFAAAEVADCVNLLFRAQGSASSSFELIRQRLERIDGFETVGEASRFLPPINFGAVAPTAAPVDLAAASTTVDGVRIEGIAVFDAGKPTFEMPTRCVGLVDQPELVGPSIVVGSEGSGELRRFPLLGDAGDGLSIVGQESVTGRNQLVVVRDRALWALDLESGEWSGPLTGPRTPVPGGFVRAPTLSGSGSRAYAFVSGSLVTFDFVVDDEGELAILDTTQLIAFDAAPSDGDFTQVVHADDDVVFVGTLTDTWSLPAPPRSSE